MNTLNFHTVDVFTETPFTGNSLAIVEQADALNDIQMQTLAREFNLPETIFIQRPDEPTHTAKVRIFLPRKEIPFAGHPTIGCAIFIAQKIYGDIVDFETKIVLEEVAGLVPVSVVRKGGAINAQLTAPVVPYAADRIEDSATLALDAQSSATAYGLSANDIELEGCGPMAHAGGPTFIFIPVKSRAALSRARAIEPLCTDLPKSFGGTGGYVYYLSPTGNKVHARMFAPGGGIPEDPATGSACAILASQLRLSNRLEEGTTRFELFQGYDMGRPSQLHLEVDMHAGSIEAVRVSGTSVSISSGTMSIPE
jgi:trans-2,3-dihydro-3-hydroxyanthranilate isomerase